MDQKTKQIFIVEAALLSPIEQWYTERAKMQSFGFSRHLQLERIEAVSTVSARLGTFVSKLLEPQQGLRPSADTALEMLLDTFGEESC